MGASVKEIELAGWISLPIGRDIVHVDYINWQNRCWLVPAWISIADENLKMPARLIAPRFVAGHTPPPGPEVLNIFTRLRLPEIVLDPNNKLPELVHVIDIVERPSLYMRSMQALVA